MPLSVDLEASIEENCAELLRPWAPLGEDEVLEAGEFVDTLRTVEQRARPIRALRLACYEPIPAVALEELLGQPALAQLEALMLPTCILGHEGGEVVAR